MPDRQPVPTLPNHSGEGSDLRKGLEWLILLRLLVAFFLLAVTIFFEHKESKYFAIHPATPIFVLLCTIFALSLLYALALGRTEHLRRFSSFQIFIDAILTTVIIYFTGGVSSAFTLLYVFSILAAGILHLRKGALYAAGLSAILFGGLVTLQFYELLPESMWPWTSVWRSHDPSYILWVLLIHYSIFFLVAVLAGTVAGELKSTKISLTIREIEYERLSDLHTNIIKSIPNGIMTTDEKDIITFVNSTGAELLESTWNSLVGRPLASVFQEIYQGNQVRDEVGSYHVQKKDRSSQTRELDISLGRLRDRRNQPLGRLVVFSDVTEMRRMELRAKQSEKQAAFVRIASGMAHEIRNPLASLRGAAELLTEPVRDPTSQHRLLGIVLREADRLNALLSDFILTVNGRQTKKSSLWLDELLTGTLDEFEQSHCGAKHIDLVRGVPQKLFIRCQADRLKQAMLNLLMNAADASSPGSKICVSVEDVGEEALVSISDTGPGIPANVRDKIFEPFFTTKDFGTGLGLPMALSIVEAHGGTIEVRENQPSGAIFVIHLPKARQEEANSKENIGG